MLALAMDDGFQAAFADAIFFDHAPVPAAIRDASGEAHASRFSVYRNNVFASLINAVGARYPAATAQSRPAARQRLRFDDDFFDVERLRVDFFAVDFFRPPDFFAPDFFAVLRRGTFAPFSRASDRPIAIACFLLVTLRPEPPLLSVPLFRLCIARLTLLPAALPYFLPPDDFFAAMCHALRER